MKRLIICLILIYAMLLCACPKETAVRRAAKASFELSGLTVDVVNATARAYQANLISLAAKDKIADRLKVLSIGGKRFNQTLERFVKESGENLPVDKLAILNQIFDSEVIAPFLEILQTLKILSAGQAEYLSAAIASLRSAILIISAGFSAARSQNYIKENLVYV